MPKLHAIPCNVITGFLGVGKTSCILDLLKQKPKSERWAILVNEFGEIGLDGQLIETSEQAQPNIFIKEVPGGCMCCSSGLPMQIALNLLLMQARPDRLLIEPTGLGHPKEVLRVLANEHYQHVLSLENTLTLVNPQHFSSAKHLQNDTFQQQLAVADLLLVNKTDLASPKDIEAFKHVLSTSEALRTVPYRFTENGAVPLALLNRTQRISQPPKSKYGVTKTRQNTHAQDADLPALPECGYLIERHEQDGFTSIGWRIRHTQIFDLASTLNWFVRQRAQRLKALIHTEQGWAAFNLSDESDTNKIPDYKLIEPPALLESRMEMIFESSAFSAEALTSWNKNLRK